MEANFSKVLIISPSGKFYGSEQVLYDFLLHAKQRYHIYIPAGELTQKVEALHRHRVHRFSPTALKSFYTGIFLRLLFGRFTGVYINEGGHSRYTRLLAKLLPQKKITIHLRMIYDTATQRLGTGAEKNIQLLAISKYVAGAIKAPWTAKVLYDPFVFDFPAVPQKANTVKAGKKIFGIIGRVSITKGFELAWAFIRELEKKRRTDLEFHFFGNLVEDASIKEKAEELKKFQSVTVQFFGYRDKKEIYPGIDAVIHFCLEEGLGRIFLEAIDAEKPFIGFRSGGLPEIANAFGLQESLVPYDKNNFIEQLEQCIDSVGNNYEAKVHNIRQQKKQHYQQFSVEQYCATIEHNIN